jgi:alpha-glucoside transport system substrate-binding protein
VQEAWKIWGAIATDPRQVRGGPRGVLLTNFEDAGRPMFDSPGDCFLEHQASFMARDYPRYEGKPKPDIGFDFVKFQSLGAPPPDELGRSSVVAADVVVMFNDAPQSRQLVQFLASEEAQQILPEERRFSAHMNVRPDAYSNDVSRRIADVLTGSETLCFDASDMMPATMQNAFYRAVQEYLSDPAQLDALLEISKVQEELPKDRWLRVSCGK